MKASTATCDASTADVSAGHEQEASDMWALDQTLDMWSIDMTAWNTATTAEFEQLVHKQGTSA